MAKYVWLAGGMSVFGHGMPSRGDVLELNPAEAASLLAEGKVEPAAEPARDVPTLGKPTLGKGKE